MFLLDTHVLIWLLSDPKKLPPLLHNELADPGSKVFISSVSTWEMIIKSSLGKLDFSMDELQRAIEALAFEELPINISHTRALIALPPLHRDPFDRMLVAQARAENLILITADPKIEQYQVITRWG